ncbi:hypothetical protein LSS_08304 [Leptospira santarosai serovar Shermani str. LT 821]|uniref:Uncharacterized protein n=1 Tax=Leptospira santarosai serovar Shermani str. LT 821 TaxID=758847 RepID=K8Y2W0_9LEPT|nr:hypothetical protein LSS_08304 [Leptospira santarosai serovar Shermani str. LT 821]
MRDSFKKADNSRFGVISRGLPYLLKNSPLIFGTIFIRSSNKKDRF